jgi:hypothetical protein
MFGFATMEEAVDTLTTINHDYERHCQAERAIAEAYFGTKQVLRAILNVAL